MSFISALPTVRPLYSVVVVAITVKSSDYATLGEVATVEVIYVVTSADYATLTESSTLQIVTLLMSTDYIKATEVSALTVHLRLKDVSKLKDLLKSLAQYGILRKYVKEVFNLADIKVCRSYTVNVAGVEVALVCAGSVIMPEYKNQRNEAMRRLRDKAYEVCLDYGM